MTQTNINTDDCWLWAGNVNKDDYGSFTIKVEDGFLHGLAHRLVYQHYYGLIPKGLVLDHLCRIPRCVNPDHLEAVTTKININRGISAKVNSMRLTQTHCNRGHELSEDNLYRYPNNPKKRTCITCRRIYDLRSKLKRGSKLRKFKRGKKPLYADILHYV